MNERILREIEMLRAHFSDLIMSDLNNWGLIPNYSLPEVWSPCDITICIKIPPGYPNAAPYGIYVPSDLKIDGKVPTNFNPTLNEKPPFPGNWGVLSWQLENWSPHPDIVKGTNLLNFVHSFNARFKELN